MVLRRAIHSLSSSSSTLPLQISIGILAASYWRGSWYVLDHILYPNERLKSGIASLLSGAALLGLQQYILSPSYNGTKQLVRLLPPPSSSSIMFRRKYIQANRFLLLYGIATSCVLLWRGTWLLWDEAAHSIADFIEECCNYGRSRSQSSEEEEVKAAVKEAAAAVAIKLSSTPMDPTTLDNGSDDPFQQKMAHHSTTTSSSSYNTATTIHDTAVASSKSIVSSSSCSETEQYQKTHQPPPQDQPPHQNAHHKHEDCHHGESSVTHHTDITDRTLFYSGIASHLVATVVLLSMGRFVSVMAPPANTTLLKDHFLHERGKKFAKAARKFMENPKE